MLAIVVGYPVAVEWTAGRVIGVGCPLLFLVVTAILLARAAHRDDRQG
ncbi:hypothetical protein GCM10009682_08380 [Luedemannella flava]|uniref:Uncharacterized protein n=1 Tax=Luedemannella flava TaxID=349316 RepID=A0ABP4XR86_9ACTN